MKKMTILAVIVVLITSTGLATAGPSSKRSGKGKGYGIHAAMLSCLNLTAEQSEKIRLLYESLQKDVLPFRRQVLNTQAELKLLWLQTTPNAEEIKAKQKALHDLKWQIREKKADYRLAFRKILTPEQLSKYLALRLFKGRGSWHGKGHHRRHGRAPGGRW
jgi:Spy/CpxP family protein refolding chaperone